MRWLFVAFTLRFMLGDLKGTREIAEQALARSEANPSCSCEAHLRHGRDVSGVGELVASRQHFEAALMAYDDRPPQRSAVASDLGVFAHAWYSQTLWLLGDESGAVSHVERAVALAQRLDHMYSLTLGLAYATLVHQLRRDTDQVLECGEAVVALCERYGFGYYGDWAQALIGWARGRSRPAEGVQLIEAGIAGLDRQRAQARRPLPVAARRDV